MKIVIKATAVAVIAGLLSACGDQNNVQGSAKPSQQLLFGNEITLLDYAAAKRFSERNDDRKQAAFDGFFERVRIAQYLLDHELKEDSEIRVNLSEEIANIVIKHYFDDVVSLQITDQKVEKYYAEHQDEFVSRGYEVLVITLRSSPKEDMSSEALEARASEIADQINGGIDTDKIENIFSNRMVLTKENTESNILELLINTKVGELTPLVMTRVGAKLFKLLSVEETALPKSEALLRARYKLTQELNTQERKRLAEIIKS